MSVQKQFLPILAAGLLWGCNSTKPVAVQAPETEIRDLDTMVVSAPAGPVAEEPVYELPVYRSSYTRKHDLLHTALDLRFDWEKEQVLGVAALRLSPYFYATDQVALDAKGFEFRSVRLEGQDTELDYDYDGQRINIDLGREYEKGEEYTLVIDYIATPSASGGSSAITSDKGLFFIDPRDEDPDKPTQIWTQGETEHNSRWFPTVDKPNERTTQEMKVTVDGKYEVLSNGTLISKTEAGNGQRTWYWKMDQPHAPYLFMLAIGEFAVVEDSWEGKPVTYYVEPEYKEDAEAIFAHTKEMLSFFSDKLGVKYPWPKYAQVVVRDYVSGAMENTTAVIFGDFVQRHKRELIDNHNDKIVAHEMFHHWFGDLVTTESWSNLTMNEGFANYSEYLWYEHKYGKDAADHHLLSEWAGYLSSAQRDIHPLIEFGYDDKEDMFDAHSYNKGGAVLHMLRNYVGDEAFFAALNLYLTDNAYSAVEAHNLRLAFEEVTGEDLNWFFNQWYFEAGHPKLEITYGYDEATSEATVTVEQVQDAERMPAIFQLPIAVDIYDESGAVARQEIFVNQRKQAFRFQVEAKPALINFDADRVLLAETNDNKTAGEMLFQFRHAPRFLDRYEALLALQMDEGEAAQEMMKAALEDPFWAIRAEALQNLSVESFGDARAAVLKMAREDEHSEVRGSAFSILAEAKDVEAKELAVQAIAKDPAYSVIGAALQYLAVVDTALALAEAEKLSSEKASDLLLAVGELYASTGEAKYLPFFKENLANIDGFGAIYFVDAYQDLARNGDFGTAKAVAAHLAEVATEKGATPWLRFGSARGLNRIRLQMAAEEGDAQQALAATLLEQLISIRDKEENPQLKAFFEQMLSDVKP